MVEEIIFSFKQYINDNNIEACKTYYQHLKDENYNLPFDYLFQKVYLHACLKHRKEIVYWLMIVYEELPEIEKIAIRQTFPYGRHLLNYKMH